MASTIIYPALVQPLFTSVEEAPPAPILGDHVLPPFHRRFDGGGEAIVSGIDESIIGTPIGGEDIYADKWVREQQAPSRHRRFQGESTETRGPDATLLEETTLSLPWPQPQLPPARRRPYPGEATETRGPDASLLEDATRVLSWPQPQLPPTYHFRFPGSAESVHWIDPNAGVDLGPTVPESWIPEQLPPTYHFRFPGGSLFVAPSFPSWLESQAVDDGWLPRQDPPTYHRRGRGTTGGFAPVAEASGMEETTQSLWFQPQPDPQPIARRCVYLDQYVWPQDETLFAAAQDISADMWAQPQTPGPRNRRAGFSAQFSIYGPVLAPSHDVEDADGEILGTDLEITQGNAEEEMDGITYFGTELTVTVGFVATTMVENVGTELTVTQGADPASGGRMSEGRYRR